MGLVDCWSVAFRCVRLRPLQVREMKETKYAFDVWLAIGWDQNPK